MAHDLSYVHEFSFDGATKAAMNEFLHNYQNPDSTYRRQYGLYCIGNALHVLC